MYTEEDSNAWSSRFRRLLLGNNVVIKSSLFVGFPILWLRL